jgi:hypothetical protein
MTRTSTGTATTGLRNVGGAVCCREVPWEDAATTAVAISASAAVRVRVSTGSLVRKLAGYYESANRDLNEPRLFGLWTLLVAVGWVVGTILPFILVSRLRTSMPR